LLVFRRHSDRLAGRVAVAAIASAVLPAALLTYVLQYCACASRSSKPLRGMSVSG
jgi:hypothetical protein